MKNGVMWSIFLWKFLINSLELRRVREATYKRYNFHVKITWDTILLVAAMSLKLSELTIGSVILKRRPVKTFIGIKNSRGTASFIRHHTWYSDPISRWTCYSTWSNNKSKYDSNNSKPLHSQNFIKKFCNSDHMG